MFGNCGVIISILLTQYIVSSKNNIEVEVKTQYSTFENYDDIKEELETVFPEVKEEDGISILLRGGTKDEIKTNLTKKNPIPESFDWRDLNFVSPVKNQGRCPACWAFSVVGAIESHVAIYADSRFIMSEQFLIDCIHDGDYYPHCKCYSPLRTYAKIVAEFGGVLKYSDYRPYNDDYASCSFKKPPPFPVPIVGLIRVRNNEKDMVIQLYRQGPLSAGINSKAMVKYPGNNIIDEPTEQECSSDPNAIDHAITIVGYNVYVGNGRKVPYWIIKNSWGPNWGSNGYYYMVRGRNACGIANDVSFPVIGK